MGEIPSPGDEGMEKGKIPPLGKERGTGNGEGRKSQPLGNEGMGNREILTPG